MSSRGLVLVTGGSGYIAVFCIAHLLTEGWRVRATLRSLSREADVRGSLAKLTDAGDKLSFVAADLNADAGWAAAVSGCDYVLHLASPFPPVGPKNDDDVVRPARDGALRVLAAARDAGVKRVVLTSSIVAVSYGRGGREAPFTEADWTDETNRADTSPYERSKTIAERAAWNWHKREGDALELVTVNPGAVLGPVTSRDVSTSIDLVKKLLDGSMPGLPRFGYPLVDVRDIADLHYRAMLAPAANGQRYLGAGPFFWMTDIARAIRDAMPGVAKRVPKRELPDWMVRAVGLFDPVVRTHAFELGQYRAVSSEKAKSELGWTPRSNEDAIIATAESLVAEGIVRP